MKPTTISTINVSFADYGDHVIFDIVIFRGAKHPRPNPHFMKDSNHATYWRPTMSSVKRCQRAQLELARRRIEAQA